MGAVFPTVRRARAKEEKCTRCIWLSASNKSHKGRTADALTPRGARDQRRRRIGSHVRATSEQFWPVRCCFFFLFCCCFCRLKQQRQQRTVRAARAHNSWYNNTLHCFLLRFRAPPDTCALKRRAQANSEAAICRRRQMCGGFFSWLLAKKRSKPPQAPDASLNFKAAPASPEVRAFVFGQARRNSRRKKAEREKPRNRFLLIDWHLLPLLDAGAAQAHLSHTHTHAASN